MHAIRAFVRNQMRAQFVEQPQVGALADQEIVQRPQHGPEAVGIGQPPRMAAAMAMIAQRLRLAAQRAFEQPARVDTHQRAQRLAGKAVRFGGFGTRQYGAGEHPVRAIMNPKQRKGIGVGAVKQCSDGLPRWLHEPQTFQICFAYSAMVRSDENQPTLAILRSVDVRQPCWSFQRRSTSRWAAA